MLNHTVQPELINHQLFGACQKWSRGQEWGGGTLVKAACDNLSHLHEDFICTEDRENGNTNHVSNI